MWVERGKCQGSLLLDWRWTWSLFSIFLLGSGRFRVSKTWMLCSNDDINQKLTVRHSGRLLYSEMWFSSLEKMNLSWIWCIFNLLKPRRSIVKCLSYSNSIPFHNIFRTKINLENVEFKMTVDILSRRPHPVCTNPI